MPQVNQNDTHLPLNPVEPVSCGVKLFSNSISFVHHFYFLHFRVDLQLEISMLDVFSCGAKTNQGNHCCDDNLVIHRTSKKRGGWEPYNRVKHAPARDPISSRAVSSSGSQTFSTSGPPLRYLFNGVPPSVLKNTPMGTRTAGLKKAQSLCWTCVDLHSDPSSSGKLY